MSVNNISKDTRLKVLLRLLKDNEQFHIACSKSGLSINIAKKLLDKNDLIKATALI
jgi:hypothetical protein